MVVGRSAAGGMTSAPPPLLPACLAAGLGHSTQHFNVGQYRRKNKGEEMQDATFFDPRNPVGSCRRRLPAP